MSVATIRAAAAMRHLACFNGLEGKRSDAGKDIEHILWMLRGLTEGYIRGEKAHRWLGYAQGFLVAQDLLRLDKAKEINADALLKEAD